MLDIAFGRPDLPNSGALVLLVHEDETPSGLWRQADEATGGAISRALTVAEFKGGKGKTVSILAPAPVLTGSSSSALGNPMKSQAGS